MTVLCQDVDLCYAIGDVHGHAGLLRSLLDVIEVHAEHRTFRIVTIGDYIDKGPDSAGALDLLMKASAAAPSRFVCLMGNHDLALVRAARDRACEAKFFEMGGEALLAQHGVRHADELPPDLIAWVSALPTWCRDEARYYVHAGLDPRLAVDAQTDEVRLSMRGRFLSEDHDFGWHVVHGHTPQMTGYPTFRPHRTNIDTGVYQTGVLTAVAFQRNERSPFALLQASDTRISVQDLTRSQTDA
jgi:serine/threonine protein phosphatase 1